ncbi:flexible cuticle protein 12-like [Aricia agestis]|uniref:flexible cuticle protein 12-like n=1 Tax=Aricia agestis TaxID=91739 RepID=UPI001C205BAD|nr:flexible cuticle protein 12-like [Aricia agestis]
MNTVTSGTKTVGTIQGDASQQFVVFALFVAAAVAGPVTLDVKPVQQQVYSQQLVRNSNDEHAEVLRFDNNNIGIDGYAYSYETSNGIRAGEQAALKNVGTENEGIEVRGEFSYIGTDGQTYTVTYVANELGFQPSAPHLPHN